MSEERNISSEDNVSGGNAELRVETNKCANQNSAGKNPNFKNRRSALDSSYTALKYVSGLPRDKFRKSDRVTDIIIFVCLLFAAVLIFVPTSILRPPLLLSLDIIILMTTIFFIAKRLGILITLSERQAVLVWDIVVATLVLGILLCINALLFINYVTHIPFTF